VKRSPTFDTIRQSSRHRVKPREPPTVAIEPKSPIEPPARAIELEAQPPIESPAHALECKPREPFIVAIELNRLKKKGVRALIQYKKVRALFKRQIN